MLFMKKLDGVRPRLDLASTKKGQQLAFDNGGKNNPAQGL